MWLQQFWHSIFYSCSAFIEWLLGEYSSSAEKEKWLEKHNYILNGILLIYIGEAPIVECTIDAKNTLRYRKQQEEVKIIQEIKYDKLLYF